jgi:uroporphyrin-III C-methyltransferase / precorrin-2 dehydrogenase / sirohydrochlorin ferrochelatase
VTRWLGQAQAAQSAFHHLIITSDDPDDLTLKQARLLGQADTVFHLRDIAPAILNRARADANRVACDTPPDAAPAGITLFLDHR